MAGLKDLPDTVLANVMARRNATKVAPCNGRSAAEQLDHAHRIGRAVNEWARRFGWSDDFVLMIDVNASFVHALRFNVTSAIRVKVAGPEFTLQSGDVFEVDLHGEGRVVPRPEEAYFGNSDTAVRAMKRRITAPGPVEVKGKLTGVWIDPYAFVRLRHPYAQPSDLDAILQWEASRTNVVADATGEIRSLVKPVLPNAMVVRGGHDTAGWVK